MEESEIELPESIRELLAAREEPIEYFSFYNYDVYMTNKRLLCTRGIKIPGTSINREIVGIRFANILMPQFLEIKHQWLIAIGIPLFLMAVFSQHAGIFFLFSPIAALLTIFGLRNNYYLEIPIVTSYDTGDITLKTAEGSESSRKNKVVLMGSKINAEALYNAILDFLYNPVGKAVCLMVFPDSSGNLKGRVGFVEASVMMGRGLLTTTGLMQETMQESVKNAVTYAKENSKIYGIDEKFAITKDIHIHIPEATERDGPSAGVSMTLALISILTGKPVRRDVAMTGEITIKGEILPIGGVKEKVIAAYDSGIRTLILPIDNQPEVERSVPSEIKDELNIHYVEHLHEALKIGLVKTKKIIRED